MVDFGKYIFVSRHFIEYYLKGRTTKRGVGVKPPKPLKKNEEKNLSVKKKLPTPHEPLRSRGGGPCDLSGPTTKKNLFFVCVLKNLVDFEKYIRFLS